MHYRFIDHTADIGIIVSGKNPQALFRHAALAMFDIISNARNCLPCQSETIRVEGEGNADLLINWLRELLYIWSVRERLVVDVDIVDIDEHHLEAVLQLEPFQPKRHQIQNEIKAVTYHLLEVRHSHENWEATIVFDV